MGGWRDMIHCQPNQHGNVMGGWRDMIQCQPNQHGNGINDDQQVYHQVAGFPFTLTL